MALNVAPVRDTKWLTLEVCRQFQRGTCSRSDEECKFAHPPKSCQVENGRVIACFDSLKVRKKIACATQLLIYCTESKNWNWITADQKVIVWFVLGKMYINTSVTCLNFCLLKLWKDFSLRIFLFQRQYVVYWNVIWLWDTGLLSAGVTTVLTFYKLPLFHCKWK